MEDIVFFYPEGHAGHFENGHPERPERVEVIRGAFLEAGLWEKYPKLPPLGLPDELIEAIHSPAYLNLLALTCRRAGHLDPDTYTTPATWELAHKSAGGASAISAAVWERNARHGFALARPPGHHAMRGQGMGFCVINNIAIAAEFLLKNYGAQRIAIIDLDLHHGNGTQDIFWKRNDVFYISTHQSPLYPGTGVVEEIGSGPGEGWTANFPLPPGSGDSAFLTIMDELILPLLDEKKPEMLLVSYGFDPHWKDPLGQLLLTANGYSRLIKKLSDWAGMHCLGRLAVILEGGYDLEAGKACSLSVMHALLGTEFIDPFPCPYKENDAWRHTLQLARSIWDL